MKAQDIVIRPIITEKSMTGVANKKYTFEVCQDANKIEIAKAVEELFGVKVQKVNTLNVRAASPSSSSSPWFNSARVIRTPRA